MTTASGHTPYVSSFYTQRHGQIEMVFVPHCDGCDWYGPQFLHRNTPRSPGTPTPPTKPASSETTRNSSMTKTPTNPNNIPDHPDQRSTPTKGFPCLTIRPPGFTAHRGYWKSVWIALLLREKRVFVLSMAVTTISYPQKSPTEPSKTMTLG